MGAGALTPEATGWPTTSRKYDLPNERSCYVLIARSSDGAWIDVKAGKTGTEISADAHALAAICGIALRSGTPVIKLVTALKEITFDGSADVRLAKRSGAPVAFSIADALGDALWTELC